MRVSKKRLEQIIKEEIDEYLALSEINPEHKADGTWARKNKGKTYSLTRNAEDNLGDSDLKIKRGIITKSGNVRSKYGANHGPDDQQCGKLNFDGEPKPKTKSCKAYKAPYSDSYSDRKEGLEHVILDGETWVSATTLERLFEDTQSRQEDANSDQREATALKCRSLGYRSFEDVLKAINNMARAADGKLLEPSKKA